LAAGQLFVVLYAQDVVGGRTVTFSGFSGAAQPDPTASTISAQLFKVNAALVAEAIGPLVSASGINNTAVGAASPSTGNFTTLKLNGGATSGAVLAGDGTSFVPTTAPGFTNGSNVNGYWSKDPSGLIRQWGTVTTDINAGTLAVAFPTNFTTSASIAVNVSTLSATDRITYVVDGTVTTSGFTIGNNGSGGYAYWEAVGY
jgi:hypothetical protein